MILLICTVVTLVGMAAVTFNFKLEEELDRFINTVMLHDEKRSSGD